MLLRNNEGRDLIVDLFTAKKSETVIKFYKNDLLSIKALVRAFVLLDIKSDIRPISDIIKKLDLSSGRASFGFANQSFCYMLILIRKLAAHNINEIAFQLNKACESHLETLVQQLPLPNPSVQYFGPPREEYGHILPQRPESDIALDVAQLMLADRIEDAINLGSQLLDHWRDGIRYKFPMTLRGLEKPKRVLEWYPMSLLNLEPIPPQELKREVEYLVDCAQSGNEVQWGKRRV